VVPKGVTLVDSAESTAHAVANLLNQAERPDIPSKDSSKIKFFVTDSAQKFQRLGKLFLGRPMMDVTHVELKE
jgi:glutamate racemase